MHRDLLMNIQYGGKKNDLLYSKLFLELLAKIL